MYLIEHVISVSTTISMSVTIYGQIHVHISPHNPPPIHIYMDSGISMGYPVARPTLLYLLVLCLFGSMHQLHNFCMYHFLLACSNLAIMLIITGHQENGLGLYWTLLNWDNLHDLV
jgi:hypothetical protein